MAQFFDKIGKDSKDMLGKGMDTDKVVKIETPLSEGLTFTSDSSNNSCSLKFNLPVDGTDLKLDYAGGSLVDVCSYKFESGVDLKKLGLLPGAKLTLKGKVGGDMSGELEYKHSIAALKVGGGSKKGELSFPIAAGFSVMDGLDVGFSGTVKPAFAPEQLCETVALSYSQKGSFGLFAGLSKKFTALEARGIYYGLPDTVVAVKATGLMAGTPAVTLGGEYAIDGATKLKVVASQSGDIKAGLKKSLRKGCDVTLGCKTSAADPAAVNLGFTVDIK